MPRRKPRSANPKAAPRMRIRGQNHLRIRQRARSGHRPTQYRARRNSKEGFPSKNAANNPETTKTRQAKKVSPSNDTEGNPELTTSKLRHDRSSPGDKSTGLEKSPAPLFRLPHEVDSFGCVLSADYGGISPSGKSAVASPGYTNTGSQSESLYGATSEFSSSAYPIDRVEPHRVSPRKKKSERRHHHVG